MLVDEDPAVNLGNGRKNEVLSDVNETSKRDTDVYRRLIRDTTLREQGLPAR